MKEAIGGVFTIQIILFFIILVNGYLAFSVNYTKAFRVKNEILSLIEQHEGLTEDAKTSIHNYLNRVNYRIPDSYFRVLQRDGYYCETGEGYCVKVFAALADSGINQTYKGSYYSVVTFVNVDIPIINKILPLTGILQVKGETKMIYSSGNNSEIEW